MPVPGLSWYTEIPELRFTLLNSKRAGAPTQRECVCKDPAILRPYAGGAMQEAGYDLLRTPLLGDWVNNPICSDPKLAMMHS